MNTTTDEPNAQLLRTIFEISPLGAFQADTKGHIIFANKQWEYISGVTEEESMGDGWMKLIYEEDIPLLDRALEEVIANKKELFGLVYRLKNPQRGIRWVRVNCKFIFDTEGNALYYIGFVEDITEHQLREQMLQETISKMEQSNRLLEVSQQASKTGGWEFNVLTGETFWTKQIYLINDVDTDFELSYDNIMTLCTPEYRPVVEEKMKAAIERGEPHDFEFQIYTSRGEKRWVKIVAIPVIKDNRVILVHGAAMDITEKKEAEMELIRAKNVAENAAKAKADFLSEMSHEIRTPLSGIIGIANLLKLDYSTDREEYEQYINALSFSADHLLELINDILDLAKIESGKVELMQAEVNIFDLISNIKSQFISIAEAKGITINSFIDNTIPKKLRADPVRLAQILNNLVSNAVKFTENGEVNILLRLVALQNDRATIHFSVKDSGIGISREFHEKVFESFKQGNQPVRYKQTGTGLGLTITQKLAELHGSKIFLKSEAGMGAEFYFDISFECMKDKNQPGFLKRLPGAVSAEKKLNGLTILYVEDNPINLMIIRKQLENMGMAPDCADSGKEALAQLEKKEYHVAILDLHMPEMDGYALAEIIQQKYPDTHIVIFTGDIMAEVKEKLGSMRIYDILDKPLLPKKMYDMLYRIGRNKNVLSQE